MSIISKLDGSKRQKTNPAGEVAAESVVNVRKAIRNASKGRGGISLASSSSSKVSRGFKAGAGRKGKR